MHGGRRSCAKGHRAASGPAQASGRAATISAVEESLRGQLLIASPSLVDRNFRRTVVLVAEHGDAGAMGVVLNRPSEAAVADAVPGVAEAVGEGGVVYAGGPVQPEAVVVLVETDDPSIVADYVVGDVGFVRGDADLDELPSSAARARVFAGYAGWSPGQLEAELEGSDWIVEPALPDDVFAAPERDLWGDVLRRKGGPFKLIATMPPDPSLN